MTDLPRRVLLIEDDPDDATLMRRGIEETAFDEFDVVPVVDLTAAFDVLDAHNMDLILLDLGLPDVASELDGLERLVHRYPHIPVVVITGESDADELAPKAADHGAEDTVFKDEAAVSDMIRAMRCALNRARFRRHRQRVEEEQLESESAGKSGSARKSGKST